MTTNTFSDMKKSQANLNDRPTDGVIAPQSRDKDTTPLKPTERMSPRYSGYAEGRKPNLGGDAGKGSPHADQDLD